MMNTNISMYELSAQYDSRASFYNKAVVHESATEKVLYSYNTPVVRIEKDANGYNTKAVLGTAATYSATTLRHVKEFLKQNGFKAGSKKEIESMYPVEDF